MSMKPSGLFEIIGTVSTFQQRFDAKMQESVQKGGTADGVNYEIEYWANLADALAYTMADKVSSSVMEKFLKDYTDLLGVKDGLADLAGDSLGDYIKEKWYKDLDQFNDYQEKMGTDPDATPLENAEKVLENLSEKEPDNDGEFGNTLYYNADEDIGSGYWEGIVNDPTLYAWIEEHTTNHVSGSIQLTPAMIEEAQKLVDEDPTQKTFTFK